MRTEQEIRDKLQQVQRSNRGQYYEVKGMELALAWALGDDITLALIDNVPAPGQGVMGVTLQMDDRN